MLSQRKTFAVRIGVSSGLLLAALLGCLALVSGWEDQLTTPAPAAGSWHLRDYASSSAAEVPPPFTRKEHDGIVTASYAFIAAGNRPLRLNLSLPAADYATYRNRFGYRQDELDALYRQQTERLDQAYRNALATGQPQDELDAIYARIKADYHQRTDQLIRERGFRFVDNHTLTADIPRIVRDNTAVVRPLALTLLESARDQQLGTQDIVALALPFTQTALAYEALPVERNGRLTAGFSPPLEVLLEGRGDCDSKTALLAAMLLNWDRIKLIGVGVPGHYLLGVLRVPARGDAFFEYDGLTYVLMEPAGPTWLPPGMVADSTLQRIGSGKVIVEPLSAR